MKRSSSSIITQVGPTQPVPQAGGVRPPMLSTVCDDALCAIASYLLVREYCTGLLRASRAMAAALPDAFRSQPLVVHINDAAASSPVPTTIPIRLIDVIADHAMAGCSDVAEAGASQRYSDIFERVAPNRPTHLVTGICGNDPAVSAAVMAFIGDLPSLRHLDYRLLCKQATALAELMSIAEMKRITSLRLVCFYQLFGVVLNARGLVAAISDSASHFAHLTRLCSSAWVAMAAHTPHASTHVATDCRSSPSR